MPDLLGVDARKISDDRLYRATDELLPHKAALETYLKQRGRDCADHPQL
jgi:hypothetical protein